MINSREKVKRDYKKNSKFLPKFYFIFILIIVVKISIVTNFIEIKQKIMNIIMEKI